MAFAQGLTQSVSPNKLSKKLIKEKSAYHQSRAKDANLRLKFLYKLKSLKFLPLFALQIIYYLFLPTYFPSPNRVKILLKYENYVGYLDLNKHGSNTIISKIAGSLSSF